MKRSHFHYLEPDYKRPVFQVPEEAHQSILELLSEIYSSDDALRIYPEFERIMQVYFAHKTPAMVRWEKSFKASERFTEMDCILITYGDLVTELGQPPLETIAELCNTYLKGVFNTLHLLPFFPSSSDRGFAIMDFEEVDPKLGNWEDICELKNNFKLMFDGVLNHVSSKSRWFQEFLNQNPDFLDFFTVFSTRKEVPKRYLRLLLRPRTTDVLTTFHTLNGVRLVWTTFSPDQIDLNYKNPNVLKKMVEILLYYVRRGADLIRLDAVTYLWDELGTRGANLLQTHLIIKLLRKILDTVAPQVALVTETNVPHEENLHYFGNGADEAQMVYNFALPPLVLHAFQNQNAAKLSEWAATLQHISPTATYFNFLDSHDGVGLLAVRNILTKDDIEKMALKILEHGGFISYKKESDGSVSPYELNITWYSAINREDAPESDDFQVKRYIASRAIALVLMGVPGIYLHGLLGSRNDAEAVIIEKQTRSINRKTIGKPGLIRALRNTKSTTHKVSFQLIKLIRKRTAEKAFHPNAPQKVLNVSAEFFTILRSSENKTEHILAVTNVTAKQQPFQLNVRELGLQGDSWRDILSGKDFSTQNGLIAFSAEAYGIYWLKLKQKP